MFQWLKNLFNMNARKKQKDEWAKYYANDAAARNNLPLDPKSDPWTS